MSNDLNVGINLLRQGKAPGNKELLEELTIGIDFILKFWMDKYLSEYIPRGGSKIKFLTGRSGSGKTHLLQLLSFKSEEMNFVPVFISAQNTWLNDFKEVYVSVLRKANLSQLLKQSSHEIIRQLGYNPSEIPENMTFVDYLSDIGQLGPITKREIRQQLEHMFLSNPLIDNNFALACSLLTGNILGHPVLEEPNRRLLMLWLEGDKEAQLASIRRLGLSPSKINKYNARHMLRSLVEVSRLAGHNGVVILVDDVEILTKKEGSESIHYTKMKREDAYESVRELIDEIDTLKNIFFVFSFDNRLIDDDILGLKSYQALWMRIQNEVEGSRFNKFSDIVDLDRLIEEVYTPEILVEMSQRLSTVINRHDRGALPISISSAEELLSKAQYGSVSLPRQVNMTTIQEGVEQ